MPIERLPKNLVAKEHIAPHTISYKVQDGDSWGTIARRYDLDAWSLINLNFKTHSPREVNWYLRNYVGCKKATRNKKNWIFTADANPGLIRVPMRVIEMPPLVITAPKKPPSKFKTLWAGLGKYHSGDLFVLGAYDLTGRIYNLGWDEESDIKNTFINVNGYKLGPGLGASISAVFIIAHGYENAEQMEGVDGGWDFDLALVAKLSSFFKGVKGLGKAVDTIDKYKKMRYLTENAIKSIGITKPGVYAIPIPLAGVGLHVWAGYKSGTVSSTGTGTGFP